MNIKITTIIPYYKNKKFFKKCFNSVKNQTRKANEIIIICDEPNKSVLKYLKKITNKAKNLRIVFNKKNFGVSYCRNLGIRKAKYNYIAFLDSDDFWHRNKLKKQIEFMKKKKLDFSHTSFFIVNEKNKLKKKFEIKKVINFKTLLKRCDIATSTVIAKKKLLIKNPFPDLSNQEDYCVWLNIAKNKNIYGLQENLSYWRKRKNSLSTYKIKKLINAFYVYKKYMGFNITNSIFRVVSLILYNISKKFKINFLY